VQQQQHDSVPSLAIELKHWFLSRSRISAYRISLGLHRARYADSSVQATPDQFTRFTFGLISIRYSGDTVTAPVRYRHDTRVLKLRNAQELYVVNRSERLVMTHSSALTSSRKRLSENLTSGKLSRDASQKPTLIWLEIVGLTSRIPGQQEDTHEKERERTPEPPHPAPHRPESTDRRCVYQLVRRWSRR
jgi:hypothetical protein